MADRLANGVTDVATAPRTDRALVAPLDRRFADLNDGSFLNCPGLTRIVARVHVAAAGTSCEHTKDHYPSYRVNSHGSFSFLPSRGRDVGEFYAVAPEPQLTART
jgi:hypothetical protein